jgi:hypothetical protein
METNDTKIGDWVTVINGMDPESFGKAGRVLEVYPGRQVAVTAEINDDADSEDTCILWASRAGDPFQWSGGYTIAYEWRVASEDEIKLARGRSRFHD